ncbi:hypothetical protein ACRALDRAFT_2041429 [Sodiomyces alcalophilus JCM 7366]|uniref:uncharacterized protein n=1 Tax=Sodiomyces alcalophilus JCM 7366 TaxID=591952 RepID=UPI0039B39C5F
MLTPCHLWRRRRWPSSRLPKNHDHSRFSFPAEPQGVSYECQDLILHLLRDKRDRLSSYRYREQDIHMAFDWADFPRRYVFDEDDAVDIKRHSWFRGVDWQNLDRTPAPFVPYLRCPEDTRYFDGDEPIADWSESLETDEHTDPLQPPCSPKQIRHALRREGFGSRSINTFLSLIVEPFDSVRLHQVDQMIDTFARLNHKGKQLLKYYVRKFGRKEHKRARDILLRDQRTRRDVMTIRKQMAFVGYTWRRAPSPPRVPTLDGSVQGPLGCDGGQPLGISFEEPYLYGAYPPAYGVQPLYWDENGQYGIAGRQCWDAGPYQQQQLLGRSYYWGRGFL